MTFRADAAFAKPETYKALEERGVDYAIRISANSSLELEIEDILFRPSGRPSLKPLVRYKSFRYQAESWAKPRRVVAKVEHHQGELFPRGGFTVTSMSLPSRSLVRFYNKRGTAEQWIKEGKQATHWTRLSCHRFRANEVRLQLSVLAYNLGNLWRRLGLPNRIKSWSLTSLQHRLMKTGGAGQARAVLLAAAGRRAFEPQAVRRHAAQDLGAAAAKRVALTGRGSTVFGSKRFRKEQCRPERRSARSINVCERMDEPWRLPAEVMCRVQREKTWYSGQRGCILSPCQGQNGNPGQYCPHSQPASWSSHSIRVAPLGTGYNYAARSNRSHSAVKIRSASTSTPPDPLYRLTRSSRRSNSTGDAVFGIAAYA